MEVLCFYSYIYRTQTSKQCEGGEHDLVMAFIFWNFQCGKGDSFTS